jgi:hypothetical protein
MAVDHVMNLKIFKIRMPACEFLIAALVLLLAAPARSQIGIWTSAEELARVPTAGPAWEQVLHGATQDCSNPEVSNPDDNSNVYALAAAIVYARTGDPDYKAKVVAACEKLVAAGKPAGNTLAWARETGAYALAADLTGYRTPEFAEWLHKMAEVYEGSDRLTMRKMFEKRPNNWGSHAFGSLCAIYRYLEDTAALAAVREYWIRGVLGPNPGYQYGKDLSWHFDSQDLRLINPKGAKRGNMSIDGVITDDMRRGSSWQDPPVHTGYAWEFMQGQIMAARILERAGMSIWAVGDSALYRAACCLQLRFEDRYGAWAAKRDDVWMLPFLNGAYGTHWPGPEKRLWRHGKNAGWGYVTLADSQRSQNEPKPSQSKIVKTVRSR